MKKPILFTLSQCLKCEEAKKYLDGIDIDVVQFPNTFGQWSEFEKNIAEKYDVLEDLKRTAPILVTEEGKVVGQLRIKKWVNDHEKI